MLVLLLTVILLTLILILPLYPPPPDHNLPWHKEWWRPPPFEGHGHWQKNSVPHAWTEKTWRMSPPELRGMIAGTNGYYVRDWSVGLGWNNVCTALAPCQILLLIIHSHISSDT
jgi:hypothetical protein